MGNLRRSTVYMLATLLVTIQPIVAAPQALADLGNCTNHHELRSYGVTDLSHLNASGSQAQIQVKPSALCNPSSGGWTQSSGWVMLQAYKEVGWSQIGWTRTNPDTGGAPQFFYQYTRSGGADTTQFWGNPSNGDARVFKVTWQNASGQDNHIHLIICDANGSNCNDKAETGWNPDNAWPGGKISWIAGETADRETDMPGTGSNRDDFDNIMTRLGTQGWETNSSLTMCRSGPPLSVCGDDYYRYHLQWQNQPTHFEIWTAPLT